MPYPFPDIRAHCSVCGESGCAVYRGYYQRIMFCPEMEFLGKVVVRTGFCRRQKQRFALLPDFVIRRRRISRLGQFRLAENARIHGRVQLAVDELMDGLPDEYWLPISTAHSYLKLQTAVPP